MAHRKSELMEYNTELLIFQATSFCNIDCKYCYLPNRQKANKFDLALVRTTLENLSRSELLQNHLNLLWHCGEPFVLPLAFFQEASTIINTCQKEFNIDITQLIQTNATLITQSTCDLILKEGISVGISIDGPQFIHDRNRVNRNGSGTFEKVLRGISLLKENKIDFTVIAVLTEYALDFPEEMFYFFFDLEVQFLGFNIDELGAYHSNCTYKNEISVQEKFKSFFNVFWYLNVSNGNKIRLREFDETISNIRSFNNPNIENTLTMPFKVITVNYNGNFSTFCPELMAEEDEKFVFGNVASDLIISILEKETFRSTYQSILEGCNKCSESCDYYSVCGGGNPSNKYHENHSFESMETINCIFMKKMMTDIVLENIKDTNDKNLQWLA